MAHQTEHAGTNRTGVQMSPIDTGAMLSNDNAPLRGIPGDERALLGAREAYIHDADGVGSIPGPGTMTGAMGMAAHLLAGDRPQILLDKLGERLAFERTSTRLYEALMAKCTVLAERQTIVDLEQLADVRRDEARHFLIVKEAIESLGGDPTAQTPSADVAGVEALGLLQVLNDARTSLAQSLHALLTAELTDGAGWETLVLLARENGKDDMVVRFTGALQQEARHLALVRGWYAAALGLPAPG
jgi:hypothetical protein